MKDNKDNKDNIVFRDKIIAFVLGILVGGIVVYAYGSYTGRGSMMFPSQGGTAIGARGNFDPSNMSDAQLQRMADRAGITLPELKQKLASGQNLRDLMPARTGSGARTGGNFQGNRTQDTTTGTGSN